MGIMFASIFAFLFLVLNDVLPAFYLDLKDVDNYLDNQEVVAIASKLLLVAALFQISDSAQIVFLGALRGLQDVKIPTLLTFTAYWIIGFPTSYFLGKETFYGSTGIWIGLLVGLASASIFLYLRFIYLTNRLIKAN
jgi:MATE family multidrug resistance protein